MPMERGEAMGNREGQRPRAPTGGIHRPTRSGSTALLHRGSASAATASISMANVRGKAGPRRAPPQGGPWPLAPPGASQHRHRAHSRRRQRPRVERLIERLRQRAGVSTQAVPLACVAIPIPACRSAAAEQRPGAARTASIITIPHSLAWPRPPGFIQALGGLMLGQIALFSVQLAAARPLALAPPYPSTSALSASSALAMAACA